MKKTEAVIWLVLAWITLGALSQAQDGRPGLSVGGGSGRAPAAGERFPLIIDASESGDLGSFSLILDKVQKSVNRPPDEASRKGMDKVSPELGRVLDFIRSAEKKHFHLFPWPEDPPPAGTSSRPLGQGAPEINKKP